MTRLVATCLAVVALLSVLPREAAGQQCTTVNASSARRAEALRAARLILSAVDSLRPQAAPRRIEREPYPAWPAVGRAPIIAAWRGDGGTNGDLVRKIRWGDEEPLPGWRMHWVADASGFAFTLSDMRDACGFSYSADERGTILQGIDVDARVRTRPVETR